MRRLGIPSRQLIKLCQSHPLRQKALAPISTDQRCRYSSSVTNGSPPGATNIDIEAIRAEMLARPPQIHLDVMNPVNSHYLTEALSEFLPRECVRNQRIPLERKYKLGSNTGSDSDVLPRHESLAVPAGHHLVYFPLQRRGSELCPDGTDPYHSPRDTPFTRRMWAGGSIKDFRGLSFNERTAFCLETIVDVNVRGSTGAEKIFVEVMREYADFIGASATVAGLEFMQLFLQPIHFDSSTRETFAQLFASQDWRKYGMKGITERRTLVFMREPTEEEKKKNLEQKQKIVKATTEPDYSVTLTPTPTLLFHYSALTYNAHRIHLDRSYCREVEGHRDLLVHGPLSLTLMLSVLQSRLEPKELEFIESIDYRHLAPLYVGQPMRVCLKLRKPGARKKWDLWVENQDGGLCVKGTAESEGHDRKTRQFVME